MLETKEVSVEEFNAAMEDTSFNMDLGESFDDSDLAVCHYTDRFTGAYLGTRRITEDGTIYLLPDYVPDGDKLSEEELFDLLYGA